MQRRLLCLLIKTIKEKRKNGKSRKPHRVGNKINKNEKQQIFLSNDINNCLVFSGSC
jgi:hypothetical protein